MFMAALNNSRLLFERLLVDDLEAVFNPILENGLKPEFSLANHDRRWQLILRKH